MSHGSIGLGPSSDTFFDDHPATYGPHFEVQHAWLRRVNMANVARFPNVPVVVP